MIDDVINGLLVRPKFDPEKFRNNYFTFQESEILPQDLDSRGDTLKYILDYWDKHHELPSLDFLMSKCDADGDIGGKEYLEELAKLGIYFGTEYKEAVRLLKEDIDKKNMNFFLMEASQILTSGKDIGKGAGRTHYEGVNGAIDYLNTRMKNFGSSKTRLFAESGEYSPKVAEEVAFIQKNKGAAVGYLSGLEVIDLATHGLQPGEFCLIAGFKGELKSTFAANWAYLASKIYRNNVLFISLEMRAHTMHKIFLTLHAANEKFYGQFDPIYYDAMKKGELTDLQLQCLNDLVVPDFQNNTNAGRLDVWQPEGKKVTVPDIWAVAEKTYVEHGLDMLFIDYPKLLGTTSFYRDPYEALNDKLIDLKNMAMTFAKGKGLAIVAPHQINRQGRKAAAENNGEYVDEALAEAHEAERSSDVIVTTFLSKELRKQNMVKFGCLKNRDGKPFDSFQAFVNFESRKIWDVTVTTTNQFDPLLEM